MQKILNEKKTAKTYRIEQPPSFFPLSLPSVFDCFAGTSLFGALLVTFWFFVLDC